MLWIEEPAQPNFDCFIKFRVGLRRYRILLAVALVSSSGHSEAYSKLSKMYQIYKPETDASISTFF